MEEDKASLRLLLTQVNSSTENGAEKRQANNVKKQES